VTGTEPLIVESELTLADWTAWVKAWSQRAQARIGRARLALATALPLVAGLALSIAWSGRGFPLALLSFGAGVGAYLVGATQVQRLFHRVSQPGTTGWFLGPVRMELSSEGIRTIRAHADATTRWPAIVDVTRTGTHAFLWVDALAAFILPLRDLADGLDADGLVERVRSYAGIAAAVSSVAPTEEPVATMGFWRALWYRLSWRAVPETGAASSDAVIACCAILSLGVWLAFDRYAAGPDPQWYPGGAAGLSWYAVGFLGLAWVLHRQTAGSVRYRSVLAALCGALPLALVLGLSAHQWAPDAWQQVCYALLAVIAVLHAHRTLAAASGASQPLALATAALWVALFAWGAGKDWVYPHLWYGADDEEEATEEDDSPDERLVLEQAERIDAAAARVASGRPHRPDVFFLGFAGVGEQKVFAEELKLSEKVVARRYGATGRSLLLVNDRRDAEAFPFATVYGLKRALLRLGERMDRDEDVLFLMLTSHGDDTPSLSVSNGSWPFADLDGDGLREALDDSGIRWRVIVISACYSGAFVKPLADDNTISVTSAAADRTSFGCSDDNDVTEFGGALMRDALPGAASLAAAFETARKTVEQRERAGGLPASSPQAHFGKAIAPHWARIEAQHR
jgi:hypothetical protein